jgi:hypothetical protein
MLALFGFITPTPFIPTQRIPGLRRCNSTAVVYREPNMGDNSGPQSIALMSLT